MMQFKKTLLRNRLWLLFLIILLFSFSETWAENKVVVIPLFDDKQAGGVPVGTVIDWWRPNSEWPVPDGYQICDGGTVTDEKSPLNGVELPDLTDKFIMGVTDVSEIGASGGSDSHNHGLYIDHDHGPVTSYSGGSHAHAVNPAAVNTTSVTSHNHSVNPPNLSLSRSTNAAGRHRHRWLIARGARNSFHTWNSANQEVELVDWGDGLDNEGDGIWPVAIDYFGFTWDWSLYTEYQNDHSHTVQVSHDHPQFNSGSSGSHSHSVDLPSIQTESQGSHSHAVDLPELRFQYKNTLDTSHIPRYFGLLKIMRIR